MYVTSEWPMSAPHGIMESLVIYPGTIQKWKILSKLPGICCVILSAFSP